MEVLAPRSMYANVCHNSATLYPIMVVTALEWVSTITTCRASSNFQGQSAWRGGSCPKLGKNNITDCASPRRKGNGLLCFLALMPNSPRPVQATRHCESYRSAP